MTEIQWIISLMMKYQLPEEVKTLCLERIGEVEAKLNIASLPKFTQVYQPLITQPGGPSNQAASTLAAMARQEVESAPPPITQSARLPAEQPKEIVTGGGSMTSIRGPNKLRGRLS